MINLLFNKPLKKIKKKKIIFNNELTKEEQHQLNELLKKFENIISIDENLKLGRIGIIKHEIKVIENPIYETEIISILTISEVEMVKIISYLNL